MAGQPPFEALESAAALGEYSLTDRGTWFAIGLTVRERMKVYVSQDTGVSVSYNDHYLDGRVSCR